jgi:raffinose/stachyose/melibiose transport system substrate-binding protein
MIAITVIGVMLLALLAGCATTATPDGGSGGGGTSGGGTSGGTSGGSVYYLNFKPEVDQQWKDVAKAYTDETGVEVTILTAASGQYETTLRAEIAKTKAPTLFQVNGPVGLGNWIDYYYNLTGTKILGELSSSGFELRNGGDVAGIGFAVETYGIIYNKALLAEAGYSQDDIKNFADLKRISEDITARSAELGFSAFTSAGMDGSSDWRYKTHLANLPIYYEYKADGIGTTDAIKGTYLDNYRQIWDLYINNATVAPTQLSTKTGDDALAEFLSGQGVFYQNGQWMYGDVRELGDENLGMLPIYIGAAGEENQGLCTGTENYWVVNKNASQADIDATLEFMYWLVTSEKGLNALSGDMGFVIPFKQAKEADNLFVNIANDYVNDGKLPVSWNFPTMPSEAWKDGVGSALTAYAAGTGDWDAVVDAFVEGWASEVAKKDN